MMTFFYLNWFPIIPVIIAVTVTQTNENEKEDEEEEETSGYSVHWEGLQTLSFILD